MHCLTYEHHKATIQRDLRLRVREVLRTVAFRRVPSHSVAKSTIYEPNAMKMYGIGKQA